MYLKSTDPDADLCFVGCFEHWMGRKDSSGFPNYVFPEGYEPKLQSHFEHGQWWVTEVVSGAAWSAHDVETNGEEYIDFEPISDGEFE